MIPCSPVPESTSNSFLLVAQFTVMTAGFNSCKTARLRLLQGLCPADKGNLIHEDLLDDSPHHDADAYEDDDAGQGETVQ